MITHLPFPLPGGFYILHSFFYDFHLYFISACIRQVECGQNMFYSMLFRSSIFMLKHFIKLNIDWNEQHFSGWGDDINEAEKYATSEQSDFNILYSQTYPIHSDLDQFSSWPLRLKISSTHFNSSQKVSENRKTFQGAWDFQAAANDFHWKFKYKNKFFDYSQQRCAFVRKFSAQITR